jgi:hypothetical protein
MFGSKAASGKHETRNTRSGYLYGDARGKKIPLSRREHDFVLIHARPEIHSCGYVRGIAKIIRAAHSGQKFDPNVQTV